MVLVGVVVWAVLWAVRSGQFDDLDGPAHRILQDEDEVPNRGDENDPEGIRG